MDDTDKEHDLPTIKTKFSRGEKVIGRDGRAYSIKDIAVSICDGSVFYVLYPFDGERQKTLVQSLVERDYQGA